ncbi:MAG TPA: DUF3015 family protein [Oligoflexus sp.]|uniref:DUF3015 family protein n=1 Tax=Oligoflexus sp. TaxID=1971216 RepID=UPI002D70C90C|nr:DUF3015 family protein [Oligoflexus sp.]HYX35513.1 DUF3015 family protein [Oligoflexus sp.]
MRCVHGTRIGMCLVLGIGLSGNAWAKRNYGTAGCGWGSQMMGPGGNQISAATTNQSTYTQAFGISSGTSNCLPSKEMAVVMKQEEFLAANLNTLQKEMAQGRGETLSAFADILGCPSAVQKEATEKLAKGYQTIFKSPGIEGVLDTAKEELKKDETLKNQCTIVG